MRELRLRARTCPRGYCKQLETLRLQSRCDSRAWISSDSAMWGLGPSSFPLQLSWRQISAWNMGLIPNPKSLKEKTLKLCDYVPHGLEYTLLAMGEWPNTKLSWFIVSCGTSEIALVSPFLFPSDTHPQNPLSSLPVSLFHYYNGWISLFNKENKSQAWWCL